MGVRTAARWVARRWTLPVAGPSTPARLLRLGVVLLLGCLLTTLFSVIAGASRQAAIEEVGGRLTRLSVDSNELFRSLADADAMATSGYVTASVEPVSVRTRYDADLADAATRLVRAASELAPDDPDQAVVTTVSQQLPVYSAQIQAARFYHRQNLPLGQSYLAAGSTLMRETMLPAVARLAYRQATSQAADSDAGAALPIATFLFGLATLLGLANAGWGEFRRTHRFLNPGLVAAAGLLVVALLWWTVATTVANLTLDAAGRHISALAALDEARVAVLVARSNESLVLVAHSGGGASDVGFTDQLDRVLNPQGEQGLLGQAVERVGADGPGGIAISALRADTRLWLQAHQHLRALDDGGHYPDAVASAVGTAPSTSGGSFQRLDAGLTREIDTQRYTLDEQLNTADAALTGVTLGPALLALLAAVAAGYGIGLRVREYR